MLDVDPRENQSAPGGRRAPGVAWSLPYLVAWGVFLGEEFFAAAHRPGRSSAVEWLFGSDDRLVYLILLTTAPLVWWLSGRARLETTTSLRGLGRKLGALANLVAAPTDDSWWRPICSSVTPER